MLDNINKLFAHIAYLEGKDELTVKESEALSFMYEIKELLEESIEHYDVLQQQYHIPFEYTIKNTDTFTNVAGAVAGMAAGGILEVDLDGSENEHSNRQQVEPSDKFLKPESMDDIYIDESELQEYAELFS